MNYDELRSHHSDENDRWTRRVRFVKIAEIRDDSIDEGLSSQPPLVSQPSVQPPAQPLRFSFDEDIGTMEDAGPLMGSTPAPPSETIDLRAAALTQFSVPKPGLKSAKRTPARGKGVVGAVLAADGSVTHEPSRML